MSLVLGVRSIYAGQSEVWTNRYHMTGPDPANDAAWVALAQAVWDVQRPLHASGNTLDYVAGYAAGNESAVFLVSGSTPLTAAGFVNLAGATGTGSGADPGNVCAWIRSNTGQRTSSNKPIYLRKYYHYLTSGGSSTAPDVVPSNMRNALLAISTKLTDGSLPNGRKWCAPQGAVGLTAETAQYFTTRKLKRRYRNPT